MSESEAFRKAIQVIDELPGIKQREIKPCSLCRRGVAHDGNFLFWRLRFDRAGLDNRGIMRQHGLELMIGPLASVMGSDPDIAKVIDGPYDVWICEPCVLERMPELFVLAERADGEPR